MAGLRVLSLMYCYMALNRLRVCMCVCVCVCVCESEIYKKVTEHHQSHIVRTAKLFDNRQRFFHPLRNLLSWPP